MADAAATAQQAANAAEQQTHTVHVVNLKRPKTSMTVDDTNGALPRSSRQCSMAHAMPQIAVTCTNADLRLHLMISRLRSAKPGVHMDIRFPRCMH